MLSEADEIKKILKSLNFDNKSITLWIDTIIFITNTPNYKLQHLYQYLSHKYNITPYEVQKVLTQSITRHKITIQNTFKYYNKITIKVFIELLTRL